MTFATILLMTVPGRIEAARLLLSLDAPEWFLRHSRAVAEVAAWLATRTAAQTAVDRSAVEAASLLHDVDKLLPAEHPARARRHGEGSAAWLAEAGHGELAELVARHPVTRLGDADADSWLLEASVEARIVSYADKRAGQRLETMDRRFASWRRRYRDAGTGGWDGEPARQVRARAGRLEDSVCAAAGVRPEDVRRLAWTKRALSLAAAGPE